MNWTRMRTRFTQWKCPECGACLSASAVTAGAADASVVCDDCDACVGVSAYCDTASLIFKGGSEPEQGI